MRKLARNLSLHLPRKAVLTAVMAAGVAVFLAGANATQSTAAGAQTELQGIAARALVKPRAQATLSSRLSARITTIPKKAGARFKKGSTLVTFECTVQRANLKKASAELFQAEKILEARKDLERHNAVSELDLSMAASDLQKAEADVAIMEADVRGCAIAAPFNGRVVALEAQVFEHVTPGQPVLRVLDDTSLRLEILVPASIAVTLRAGSSIIVLIDETQKTYTAHVRATGASVDPASQILQVYADVEGQHSDLLPGMSGMAYFNVGN